MTVQGCRYPKLPCDRICMECRGDFDGPLGRVTGANDEDGTPAFLEVVDDQTAMNRMLREFGDPKFE